MTIIKSTIIKSLFVAILFTARASIAFVPPKPGRSWVTRQPLGGSLSPLGISFQSTSYSSGLTLFGHSRSKARQFVLCASSGDEEAEEMVQKLQQLEPKSAGLKELLSQIDSKPARPRYQLGVGKNMPVYLEQDLTTSTPSSSGIKYNGEDPVVSGIDRDESSNNFTIEARASSNNHSIALNWNVPEPAKREAERQKSARKKAKRQKYDTGLGRHAPLSSAPIEESSMRTTRRLLHKGDEMSAKLTKAVWDEGHFDDSTSSSISSFPTLSMPGGYGSESAPSEVILPVTAPNTQQPAITDYQDIDLSIPSSVYSLGASSSLNSSQPVDLVWDLMRREAYTEAAREPLLVSFLYSTILNHPSLESALSFHLANRLSSPAMLSTQIMSLIREALDADPDFRRNLRADMLAVRDRDPACNCLPDVFLYFKGFHALQTYRVAHYLWRSGRRVLAHYMQSQVSQHFQIDIHPNATIGSGTMLDHGTGIVIGETAHLGHNCSVLHHVTLGGSGSRGVDRHPKVGNGVLLGAGASVLGNIQIGDGCQVGAGTLVIEDLPPRSVAVGVPAKIIGRFVDVTAQPSIGMNQLGSKEAEEDIVMFGMDGI